MKLLAVVLIALATSFPALANGLPCGDPPKLQDADVERAINAAVRADLGAAPVETPFLERARQTVDELAQTYGVTRAQIVARYVFHICEALHARGTDGEQLSQLISRVEQALDQPAPAEDAGSQSAPGATDSGEPPDSEVAGPVIDEASEQPAKDSRSVTVEALEAPAIKPGPAPEPKIRRFRQYRAAPKRPQNSVDISQFGAPRRESATIQPNTKGAPRIGGATTPSATVQPQSSPPAAARGASPPAAAAPETSATARPTPSTNDGPAERQAAAPRKPEPESDKVLSPDPAPAEDDNAAEAPEPSPAPSPDQPRTAATEAALPPEDESTAPKISAAPVAKDAQQAEPTRRTAAGEPNSAADAPPPQTDIGARATASETSTSETKRPQQTATAAPPSSQERNTQDACPDRGVLGPECFDVDAALERLRDRPVEYNHPEQMIKGQATEITLVLRTEVTGGGLPEQASEAFEGLQGEVKQQRAKIANIMSARLRGRDFEVDPKGMHERTITWRRPVEWSWYVTPNSGGEAKRLELELYAHIVNPQGETQPPVLIKTLDATIDVDVRTLDWLIEQARTFEPLYAVAAAIIGLLTALLTVWVRRRSVQSGDGPPSGITASNVPPQRRVSDMSAAEAAAEAARKGQEDSDKGNGRA